MHGEHTATDLSFKITVNSEDYCNELLNKLWKSEKPATLIMMKKVLYGRPKNISCLRCTFF